MWFLCVRVLFFCLLGVVGCTDCWFFFGVVCRLGVLIVVLVVVADWFVFSDCGSVR